MGEQKKILFALIGGLAVLFFMYNNFYLPLGKKNAALYKEYKELRKNVKGLGDFSEKDMASKQQKIEELSADLDKKIPPVEKRLNITEHFTHTPEDLNISFTEINRKAPEPRDGYRALPVEIKIKSTLYDFLRYLAEMDKAPLFITADNINIRKAEGLDSDILNISVSLFGYQATKSLTAPAQYIPDKFILPPQNRIDRLLEPVTLRVKALDLSPLKAQDPFAIKGALSPAPEKDKGKIVSAAEMKTLPLKLKGITQIGDKKAALINNKVVEAGDEIEGMKVVEISKLTVVLSKAGQKYILKLGREVGR